MTRTGNELIQELCDAAAKGQLERVQELITRGADVNGTVRELAPLSYAVEGGREGSEAVVQLLLSNHAEVDTAMGSDACPILCTAASWGRTACASLLLQYKANVNICSRRGSALQAAVIAGYPSMVKLLLDHGIDVNLPGGGKFGGALHAAARVAHEDVLHMLLEKGADANKGHEGSTPLQAAVEMLSGAKVKLLLEYGAVIDNEILRVAARRRHREVLEILLSACPGSLAPGVDYTDAVETASMALRSIPTPAVSWETEGFTVARVRSVWQDALDRHKWHRHMSSVSEKWPDTLPRDKRAITRRFCERLYKNADTPVDHFNALDRATSQLLRAPLWKLLGTRSRLMPRGCPVDELGDAAIVNQACKILSQLPPTSVPLSKPGDIALPPHYTVTPPPSPNNGDWERLQVVVYMNSIVIETALYFACNAMRLAEVVRTLDVLGHSLKMAAELKSGMDDTVGNAGTWFIVNAYLWTTWSRIRLLLVSSAFQLQILHTSHLGEYPVLSEGLKSLVLPPQLLDSIDGNTGRRPRYMCNWTYRLITTSASLAETDLRRLVVRYNALWGDHPARCNNGSQPCSGESHETCRRFVGSIDAGQYAHDWECGVDTNCHSIPGDSSSYAGIQGAAAVDIGEHAQVGRHATYREASDRTLVISHVWAHGQGGRPEVGINSCLHQRYCRLANKLGCDSYWIDTLCIPEDHSLRRKAISMINTVFTRGKICLICDRDVMEIDISSLGNDLVFQRAQVELRETILATVLFSDWNVRAWTFLEATQGRKNLFLLCKNNDVISLSETIQAVMLHGGFDIGVAFLTTPHLTPEAPSEEEKLTNNPFDSPLNDLNEAWERWAEEIEEERKRELDEGWLEHTASLLRHRPASRDGDSFVIWQILAGAATIEAPHAFWRLREESSLTTGFLMTAAPRVQGHQGLTWAPCDTVARRIPDLFDPDVLRYPAVEMFQTSKGHIADKGFQAPWEIFKFELLQDNREEEGGDPFIQRLRDSVRMAFEISGGRSMALLRPFRLITGKPRRKPTDTIQPSVIPLVTVCEFCPVSGGWKWLGVRFFDSSALSPKFEVEDVLLV